MRDYWLYRTHKNHLLMAAEIITCDTDTEAIHRAKQRMKGPGEMELWSGRRCITKLSYPADAPSLAPSFIND